jgi:sugar phosphate isomerase/epimerase
MFMCLNSGAIGVKGTFEELIPLAGKAGFGGFDVNIRELAEVVTARGADAVRSMMADAGLSFGSAGLPVRWNGEKADYDADLRELPRLAKAAGSVGATRVSQWIPCASDTRKFRENFRWHLARLKPIAEILGEHGLRLGLEFLGPRHFRVDGTYGFISTAAGMISLAEAIGTGNVGLLLDAFHWYTGYGTVADLKALTNDDIVNVHINDAIAGVPPHEQIDNKRALPGETGVIDLAAFLTCLGEIGYDGPVAAEPFSQRVREMSAEKALETTFDSVAAVWKKAGLS